jgi:outer membrane lipoprotein-sorting protein
MMIALILTMIFVTSPGEDILDKMTSHYSKADGIQWTMKSASYSSIFDETENTVVEFDYNPPDTFYFKGPNEETIGIADTIWTMSKKHHQIQKSLSEDNPMPTDFILNWKARYDLVGNSASDNGMEFNLKAHEGVTPPELKFDIDKFNHLISLYYKDASGNDVTLTVTKERLSRVKNIKPFYKNIPSGFKLIDLTQ